MGIGAGLNKIDQDFIKQNDRSHAWAFVFLFLALIGIDQLTKNFAHNVFRNQNFAFSLAVPVWLMYLIYALVLSALIYHVIKNHYRFNLLTSLAFTLIFAGAISNIAERIIFGSVKDFIYINIYNLTGVYNIADGYIILGVLLLLFLSAVDNK